MVRHSLLGGPLAPVLWVSLAVLAFANACSSSAETPAAQMLGTSGTSGTGPVGGATSVTAGNGGANTAGSAGAAVSGGTAGAAMGGSSGAMPGGTGGVAGGAGGDTAGVAGAAPGGAGSGGQAMGGMQGMQADPGTEGDGMATQNEPYNVPPEANGLLNGATAGQVIGPLKYASPAIYAGLMCKYLIYVPSQYEAGKPAALMVFQDDNLYVDREPFHAPTVFDNLIHEGAMPVTIGLFVGTCTPTGDFDFASQRLDREAQYSVYNDTYASFLLEEIIPNVIQNTYDIVNDPDGWAIGGQSSGGNCSLIVGMLKSDRFHKILTDNGAFDNADRVSDAVPGTAFPAAIENSPLLPLRVSMLSGPNDIPATYQYNVDVAAALAAKGYHYRYIEGSGGHYPPTHAIADFPEQLRWLWRGYTLPWYQ